MTNATSTFSTFSFDKESLTHIAENSAKEYSLADPCPHIVFDDFLPVSVTDQLASEFPSRGDIEWRTFDNTNESKLSCSDERSFGPTTRHVIGEFNGPAFLAFLETLTNIHGLIPDPYLRGGGLHRIERGGFLKIHADFNRHTHLNLYRRLNVLFFLNKDWKEGYGGHFELWDREMKECRKRIAPIFNRCVIFTTSEESFHGHPDPLDCPPGCARKSIALYYYTSEAPTGTNSSNAHSTVFCRRPGQDQTPISVLTTAKKLVRRLLT